MRKKIILIVGVVALGGAALAFTGGHKQGHDHKKMIEKKVAYMTEQLNLTADQQTKVKEISEKYAKIMMEKKSAVESREEMKPIMMETMMKAKEEIKALLTDEQKAKFENLDFHAMHKEHHKEMHSKMKEIHDELFPVLLEKRKAFDSKLTVEEQATIKGMREIMPSKDEMHGKMKEMHKKHGEYHKGDMNHEEMKKKHAEMKEEMKTKHAEMNEKTKALDPIVEAHKEEIKKIFEEMKAEFKAKHGEMEGHHKKFMHKFHEEHFPMMAKHFLTLEVNEEATVEALEITTFPNPAVDMSTITYELKEAQEVKVSILNSEGTLLKEVFTGTQEKGNNEVKVDLTNLKTTDFFIIQVEGKGTAGTQKILLKK